MTWKIWLLLIILAGSALIYILGSRPRKHRPLASFQPGGSSGPQNNVPLGTKEVDMGIVRGGRRSSDHIDATTHGYGVEAMKKKYRRD